MNSSYLYLFLLIYYFLFTQMDAIILSENKINELQKRYKSLKNELERQNEEHARGGGANESRTETAAFSATQRTLEAKVNELKVILSEAKVLPDNVHGKKVKLGNYVELKRSDGIYVKYRLVHPLEASPVKNLVSVNSPLGQALLDKKISANVTVNKTTYTIVSIN